jgi:hypothetical protein
MSETQEVQEEAPKEDSKVFFDYLKAQKVTALVVLHDMVIDTRELMKSANGSDGDKIIDSFTLGALDEDLELIKDIITHANVLEASDLLAYIPDLDKILLDTVNGLAETYNDIRAGKSLGVLWSRLASLHGDLNVALGTFIRDLMEEIKELRAELQKVQGSATQGSA